MTKESPPYTVPELYAEEIDRLEERHCQVTGHAVSYALQGVTDLALRDQIAGAFMAMSGSLALHQEQYKGILRRVAPTGVRRG